jgi:hypothetical protein
LLTCKEFLQELNEYLDETADQELKARLQDHVTECPNCFVVLDTTMKTIKVFKGLEAQEIPNDVHGRLMRAVEKRCAERRATSKTDAGCSS